MISRLYTIISRTSARFPLSKAIIETDTGREINYRDLDARIETLSGYICRQGLRKGERMGILSRNSIDSIAVFFAITKSGGIAVWFNHDLDAPDIASQVKDCGLSALYAQSPFLEKAKKIRRAAKSIRFIMEGPQSLFGCMPDKKTPQGENQPAAIIYTSGTTGPSLGVVLSHKNLISNAASVVRYSRISKNDRICCVLPLFYIYGLSLALSHFLAAGTVILDNRFMYPGVVLDAIDKYRATGFAGVSGHYAILLRKTDIGKRKLPTLRYFMQAGDAMPPRITNELLRKFPNKRLYLMYGLTEASPRLTYLDPALALKKPDSVGKAVPGVRVKVVDSLGRECEAGVVGEIIASGDNVMLGYWNNKKETAKTIRKGWLFTGDMGFKDKEGDLFIVGRKGKVIKYSKILKLVPKGVL